MLATEELLTEAAQSTRLAGVLGEVLRRVPLYSGLGDRLKPGLASWHCLPIITKAEIRRDFPRNFLGAEADLDQLLEDGVLELEHTSGTSEPRTPLLLPRGWWAAQERRALQLNPVAAEVLAKTPEPRRVTISSPVCSSEVCFNRVPTRNDRIIGNTLFLSLTRYPFLWSDADLARMAAEAVEWQPQFLDLDPVYGVVFARYCEQQAIRLPSLKFILCSYEFVSTVHRRILERVFKVPVFNLYGSTETGHLLMEDGGGEMRPCLQTAYLELGDFFSRHNREYYSEEQQRAPSKAGSLGVDPKLTPPGDRHNSATGELIVTTLTNHLMPLVRYRIGDLVERRLTPYRTRYVVHGREVDTFLTSSGQRVTTMQVDECFEGVAGVAHYQVVERQGSPWLLRFVPDRGGPSTGELSVLSAALQQLLELAAPPKLEPTPTLLAENSGKFRVGYPQQPAGAEAGM